MAAVYLARSRGVGGFQREVAIKLTHPHLRSNPDFAADLIEEAKLAVRIRHPNVVPIVDVGEDAEGVFLVMDYVEGDSLSGLLRRGIEAGEPLPLGIGMRILIDALAGLHAAHELLDDSGRPLGIVHRDFTPQNLLIGIDGVARLADFGIARAAGRVGQTRVGTVKGKITYMAPEQARSRTLDRRCDVWAAGVVAWELLAGRRLHENVESEVGLMYKIVSEPPPRLRTVVPQVSQQFDHAVASALMLEADERTPSAAMLARDLTAACRAYGHLAELDEVAAYVQRVVGPKLARRRDRINQSATMRAAAFHLGQPPPSEIPAELSSEVEISVEETGGEVAPSNLELSSAIRFDALEPVRTDTTSSVGSPTARPAAKIKRTGTIAAIATAAIGVVLLERGGRLENARGPREHGRRTTADRDGRRQHGSDSGDHRDGRIRGHVRDGAIRAGPAAPRSCKRARELPARRHPRRAFVDAHSGCARGHLGRGARA